jgi:hypothetical protein
MRRRPAASWSSASDNSGTPMRLAQKRRPWLAEHGYSLAEVVVVCGLAATLTAIAVPPVLEAQEGIKAAGAARYVAGRLQFARMEALKRSSYAALRVTQVNGDYQLRCYLDGNGNGVRTAEIASGTDLAISSPERLADQFAGVAFGIADNVAPIDAGDAPLGTDPIRVGASGMVSFSPVGGASPGTLYVRSGARHQFAVRITSATGRIRVLEYDFGRRLWRSR